MCSSDELLNINQCFDEEVKHSPVRLETYLGRLELRTHDENDTLPLAEIFSNPISRKYLLFLQPPSGWGNDPQRNKDKLWTKEDFLDRVRVQTEARTHGKSCVLNIILLSSKSGESEDRCIGTTGFVTIDENIGYLGIITDPTTTRLGYATEALYTATKFAFEKLGINHIIMQTDERNENMRGWCENLAGLEVFSMENQQMNDHQFTQYTYTFTFEQWNNSIQHRLQRKMNQFKNEIFLH